MLGRERPNHRVDRTATPAGSFAACRERSERYSGGMAGLAAPVGYSPRWQLDMLMKAPRIPAIVFRLEVIVVFVLLVTSVSAEAALRIQKAVCGANDSWCDVTVFLQSKVKGDTLSTTLSQPFEEIGGDPAPDQVKQLIIDYRLSGASYRLVLTEQYPVAFAVELPSSEAAAPGADPQVTALMEDATSHVRSGPSWFGYLGYGLTIVSVVWAIIATIKLQKMKKHLRTRT